MEPIPKPPWRDDLLGQSIVELERMLSRRFNLPLDTPLTRTIGLLVDGLNRNGIVWWFGNGGSATQAEHFASELLGKFQIERPPLASASLVSSTAAITAIANDYDFTEIFSRQVQGLVRPPDVVVGISTSGTSENVLKGLRAAVSNGAVAILMTGNVEDRDTRKGLAGIDLSAIIDTGRLMETAAIQERHGALGHTICRYVERTLFRKDGE